jgi:K+-transporting ATPase KdpF subunit
VSGSGVIANAMGGVLALLLLGYLFYALVRPEKF